MFRVTYEIVTDESAEYGEADETGFVLIGEWKVDDDTGACPMSLREALRLVSPSIDCGQWWTEADARIDYVTGAHETRSLHPPRTITPSSYRRICRLLGAR